MAQPAPAPTTDRLPWLTEVPRTPPPAEKKQRRFPWEWLVAALLVLAVGVLAYWLGTRPDAAPTPATSDSLTEPAPQPATSDELNEIPSVSDMTDNGQIPAEPVTEEPETGSEPKSQAQQPVRRERPRVLRPSAEPQPEEAAPETPAAAIPSQPVVRGRIIQIGAYPTKGQADLAWQYVVKKWPYLASKPKLVAPIEVRSTDGRATRMYRLQMATSSQAQSAVICQRLETSKVSCVVVY